MKITFQCVIRLLNARYPKRDIVLTPAKLEPRDRMWVGISGEGCGVYDFKEQIFTAYSKDWIKIFSNESEVWQKALTNTDNLNKIDNECINEELKLVEIE